MCYSPVFIVSGFQKVEISNLGVVTVFFKSDQFSGNNVMEIFYRVDFACKLKKRILAKSFIQEVMVLYAKSVKENKFIAGNVLPAVQPCTQS